MNRELVLPCDVPVGGKVVRMAYMDEAGISRNEPFLTVGAVMLHADNQLIAVERHLDRLVKAWIPEDKREGFVFHAKDLFNGGGVFDRETWPLPKRLELADALALIPKRQGLTLALGAVDKEDMGNRRREEREAMGERDWAIVLHATAFSGCVLAIDDWMKANHPSEVSLLIAEDNDQSRKMIRDVIRYQQTPKAAEQSENYKHLFPLKRIKEDPLFQPKRSSSVLQLADFWAYVAKRRIGGDSRYERYWKVMRPLVAPSVFDREQRPKKPAQSRARSRTPQPRGQSR